MGMVLKNVSHFFLNRVKQKMRPLKKIYTLFSNTPLGGIQFFYILSSKYVLKSRFLNVLGCQVFRIKVADFLLERRQRLTCLAKPQNHVTDGYCKMLDVNGLIEVPNVLPKAVFERVVCLSKRVRDGDLQHKHFIKAGAEYREIVIKDCDPDLYAYLTNSFWLTDAVKSYLAKKSIKQEWRIKLIRDHDGSFDQNTLWHADTFFNTLKAFIYIDDVPEDKDVFNYILRSHRMSQKILKLHYKYSRAFNKQPWPSQEEIDDLGLELFHKSIQSNTLLLADTRGLHRRRPKKKANDDWRATLFCSFRSTPFKG
jgi:hypothetical protein